MKKLKIIFAGGGTGGHLFPALIIADCLKSRVEPEIKADFRFIGTKKGLEYRMRDRLGYPLSLITVRGLSRSGILRNLIFPVLLFGAVLKSLLLILKFNPDIIVGTGGYVMGPVLLAAIALNRRSVIHEQNSYPGLTTRKLAAKVDRVYLGFGSAKKYLNENADTFDTGNPVKGGIGRCSRDEGLKHFGFKQDDKVILILGGSQGASSINQNVLDNLGTLPDDFRLIWQTGELNYKEITEAASGKLEPHAVFPFTEEIEKAYAAADIAIARAGALTLAELEAVGLPSILIPYPFAAEDHQRKNADIYAEKQAAVVVDNAALKEYNIVAMAVDLIESGQVMTMKQAINAMKEKRERPAVDIIAEEILKLINIKGKD